MIFTHIDWNESEIKWFFDDIKSFTLNINQKLSSQYIRVGEPFDKPFRLQVQLGVGGGGGDNGFFPNQDLSLEDVINWKCSLLIIDYVRIYKWENGSQILNSISNKVSVDKICQEVMPLIAPKTSTTLLIVSIISSFLLLVLISIIVLLLIRQRNLKRNNDNKRNDDDSNGNDAIYTAVHNYDDICDSERYDDINNGNEYNEPYEELPKNCVMSEGTQKYEEMADLKTDRNSNSQYLAMTKK
jgi:hypothetical protein